MSQTKDKFGEAIVLALELFCCLFGIIWLCVFVYRFFGGKGV